MVKTCTGSSYIPGQVNRYTKYLYWGWYEVIQVKDRTVKQQRIMYYMVALYDLASVGQRMVEREGESEPHGTSLLGQVELG